MSAFKSAISSDSPMQATALSQKGEKKSGTINNVEQQITSCSQRPSVTLYGSASRHPAVKSNTSPSSPSTFFEEIQHSDPPTPQNPRTSCCNHLAFSPRAHMWHKGSYSGREKRI